MIRNVDLWFKGYIKRLFLIHNKKFQTPDAPLKVLFTICDHFEPYWNIANTTVAYRRVTMWLDNYQLIASRHTDHVGRNPKHCFFFPEEEYQYELMELVAQICRNGFGEVEIHLHHDNDTSENLRKTLFRFKAKLSQDHGLLATEKGSGEVKYGFIHGNWALDNSRPDGKWCGVNNELDILQETGCYADFTMPSAPDITQTSTINSIYYAIDDPQKPKSHDTGQEAEAGIRNVNGLLCIQGPLGYNIKSRKYGIIPRIENGCLAYDAPATSSRIQLWRKQQIHVVGRPDVIFIKLHTHGTQENNMEYFFKHNGLDNLFSQLEEYCHSIDAELYYVSARQMYNIVKGLEEFRDIHVNSCLDQGLTISY